MFDHTYQDVRNQEKYFGGSWSHIFYIWKTRKVMLGRTIREVLRRATQRPMRVVVLGCGSGAEIFDMADACRDIAKIQWFGLDLNIREVFFGMRRSQFRQAEQAKQAVQFLAGNLLELPFDDGSVDILVSSEVVEHLLDPRPAITEMLRVLKPGGYALVTTPNPDNMVTRLGYAIDHMTGGGLKRSFWKGHDAVSAPVLRAEVGHGHVSVHPYGVWRRWLEQSGLVVERKVRGPATFGGPFFDRHTFMTGCLMVLDPLLDRLPGKFLLSESLGMLCRKKINHSELQSLE